MADLDHPDQWYGGRTYAQHGDDLIILNICKRMGAHSPSYLDIGAHHPFDLSNTALLYKRGCRGINVEPNPNLIGAFHQHRPEDVNLNVGVGSSAGNCRFYLQHETSGRNSFLPGQVDGITSQIDVMVVTVPQILDEYNGGKFPNVLTIDTEGMDYEILTNLDFRASSPLVICTEVTHESPYTSLAMRLMLQDAGFAFVIWAGSNMIFAHREIWEQSL